MSPVIPHATKTAFLSAALLFLLVGCSTPNSQSVFDPQTGKHPADWVSAHPTWFLDNPSKCYECHGSDLHGGISAVSCFSASFNGISCHASGPGHAAGWANPAQHGAAAKAAPNSAAMQGFSTCQLCHAGDFTGGFANQTCLNTAGCHGAGVMSPHPVSWSTGTTSTYHHNTTDPGNAPVCALCHSAGANSPLGPIPPLPGTPPGCFNSTLCHGAIGHPAGWAVPAQHGTAAKAAPNAQNETGFSICQTCHGNDFTGGISTQTCLNTAGCHGAGVNAPHAFPWKSTSPLNHNTTDSANGPVCGLCHLGNPATPTYAPLPPGANPGCFNGTLCHTASVGSCTSCHSISQNGRRIITGASGDFVKFDHHVTNGTTAEIVNDQACTICHGNLITDKGHPTGAPTLPAVQLMDPDTGLYLANTDATAIEQVCAGCHDSNGAARLGANAHTPFNVAATADNTNPPDIGWTAGQQAHSVNGSYGGCLACHGDAGVPNAHGSSQPMMMKYTYNSVDTVKATTNVCYNCHGQTPANGTTKDVGTDFLPATQLYGHASIRCIDCHDQHGAKTGSHTNGTTLAGVLNGATGIRVTAWNANWGGVATYAPAAAATAEWNVCFKCHAGTGTAVDATPLNGPATSKTDLGLEFNPNNASYHPVIQALTSGTANHRQLAATALTGGWAPGSVMTCTDCHATDTAASKGPHGSAVKWMLNPNTTATKYYNWPYTSAANNGTSSGTLLTRTSGNTTNFCMSCHQWSGGGGAHTVSNHGSATCVGCHIRVPHGGKVYRLLATKPAAGNGNLPARYWPDGNGGGTINLVTINGNVTSGTLGESDVQTSCGHHTSAPANVTNW